MKIKIMISNRMTRLVKALILGTSLMVAAVQPSFADDIDIYAVNRTQNLLMLFDTSLSMSRLENFDPGEYNPDFIYPKSNNGFDPDSVYVGTSDLLGLVELSDGSTDTEINVNKLYRINSDNVHCPAVTDALATSGVYDVSTGLYGVITSVFASPQGALRLWEAGGRWYGTTQLETIFNRTLASFKTLTGIELWNMFGDTDPAPSAILNCRGSTGGFGFMHRSSTTNPYTSNSGDEICWHRFQSLSCTLAYWPEFYTAAWSGNYLNYQIAKRQFLFLNLGYSSSRLGITRAAMLNALEELKDDPNNGLANLRMGMMRFDIEQLDRNATDEGNAEGGYVDVPMGNLFDPDGATESEQYAHYNYLKNKVLRYHPAGATPLSETMYEAYNYLTAGPVIYGANSDVYWLGEEEAINTWLGGQPNNYNFRHFISRLFGEDSGTEIRYPSVRSTGQYTQTLGTPSPGNINRGHDRYFTGESYYSSGDSYEQPEYGTCPTTQFVLFTDGAPTQDTSANNAIRALISGSQLGNGLYTDCGGNGSGDCAEELAYYMANNDLDGDPDNDENMHVNTHVVAGFLNSGWLDELPSSARSRLQRIASAGNGNFYEANDYQQLANVFKDIFSGFTGNISTFSSPGLTLSSTNRLRLSDQLYFPLFDPGENMTWEGNLKRYRLNEDGLVVDADGQPATDDSGKLISTSRSFWSETEDGESVSLGGMSSRLNMGERKIFTSVAESEYSEASGESNLLPISVEQSSGGSLLLTITDELLNILTDDVLGLLDASIDRESLIGWIGGVNPDGSARLELEDPLHSTPVMLRYLDSSNSETRAVFIGTNSGYLHAFNPDIDPGASGDEAEYFSFIPRELLRNPAAYYSGAGFFSNKRYGMDGPINYLHLDTNRDGFINNGEKAYLYAAMRRGGQTLYALDVSDVTEPRLMWQANGDYSKLDWYESYGVTSRAKVNIPGVVNLPLLGQTWSAAKPAEVKWRGERRFVIFLGAGYDPVNDPDVTANPGGDQVGNTIYMLDAETGELLWDAHTHANLSGSEDSDMSAAFAADVIPIDRDNDALTDLLYAADINGRLWRFDLNTSHSEVSSDTDFAQGAVIADVNRTTSGLLSQRRFYHRPDVSIVRDGPGQTVIIGIGSGWRANPRDMPSTNPDYDQDYYFVIKDKLGRSTPDIASGQQYPRHLFDELDDWGASTSLTSSNTGWKVPLNEGEKVLAASTTYKGLMFFTTYRPTEGASSCGADLGRGSMYVLNLYSPNEPASQISGCCGEGIPSEPSAPMFPGAHGVIDLDPTGAGDGDDDQGPADCSSSVATIMVGTKAVRGNFNQCSALQKTYWREL